MKYDCPYAETQSQKIICLTFIAISMLSCAAFFGTYLWNRFVFGRDIGDYLKRAADANTVDLAVSQLKIALDGIESKGYTNGTTAVIFNAPRNDLGFWHKNIKAAYDDLNKLPKSDLERTEVVNTSLLKLRQTLLDHGSDSENVTTPPDIAQFPHNVAMFVWISVSGTVFVTFVALFLFKFQ